MYPRISDLFPDLFGFRLPFPIYSCGFMLAVAALAAGAGILGARLLFILERPSEFARDPLGCSLPAVA